MNNIAQITVGIDICKDRLDVHCHPIGKAFSVSNDAKGIKKLIRTLSQYDVKQVAYEPSGGYEYLLSKKLDEKGYAQWPINPKRIRAFIDSEGIHAKNDSLDASMIALFASQKQPKYETIHPSDNGEALAALSKRRIDMVKLLVKEKNRDKNPAQVHNKKRIKKMIKALQAEIEDIDTEIDKLIMENPEWRAKKDIIGSVPGVGKVTSGCLIALMPELGKVSEKAAAAIVGVAPIIHQSGASKGTAAIKGGRAHIRSILYMAAVTAIRYNEKLKEFYEKLRKANKCFKVAIVAVMRKLIIMLNAMLASGKGWNVTKANG